VRSIAEAVVIKDENTFFLTEADGRVPLDDDHGFGLYYHSSNPGHALWAGIADPDKAQRTVERLMGDALRWKGPRGRFLWEAFRRWVVSLLESYPDIVGTQRGVDMRRGRRPAAGWRWPWSASPACSRPPSGARGDNRGRSCNRDGKRQPPGFYGFGMLPQL
jgi:hypothetical protein